MEIQAEVTLPFPRERVFQTYRDRLPDLVDHLPNIRRIQVLRREEREGGVALVNEWVGGGDIPSAARAVIRESMLTWLDHATWRQATYTVEWRTEVGAFPGAVESSGTNRFVEVPGGTRLEIRGRLLCDASKIPGVPRLLARSVGAAVAKFLVGQVQVNAVAVANGLGKLLERDTEG